jgi:hypothetical protein
LIYQIFLSTGQIGTPDALPNCNRSVPVGKRKNEQEALSLTGSTHKEVTGMKRNSFIGVIVLVALLVVFAGISQAGGWMHKSSGDEKPVKQTMETAQQAFRPSDFGESGPPLEYWEALGTGFLSSGETKPVKQTLETAKQAFRPSDFGEGGPPLEYWEALGTGYLLMSDEGKNLRKDDVNPPWWMIQSEGG